MQAGHINACDTVWAVIAFVL